MANKFADKLAKMDSEWSESKTQHDTMFGKVPAGDYISQLQGAKIVEAKTSGALRVQREHAIIEGECKGQVAFDGINLETPMGMAFFRHWLDVLGLEAPNSAAEIPDYIDHIVKMAPQVKIRVSHNDDFVNVRCMELIAASDVEGDTKEPEQEPGQKKAPGKAAAKKKSAPSASADDEDLESLVALGAGQGITELKKAKTVEEAVAMLSEYSYKASELEADEIALLEKHGLDDEQTLIRDVDEGEPEQTDEEKVSALRAFAKDREIKVGAKDGLDEIIANLNEYSWSRGDLETEEAELLENCGVELED